MYGPRKKHFKPVVLPFHDEEGIALVSSSRGLGHEKNLGSYRRFRGNICSRSVALFLGLLVLAATYRVGQEMGGGSGGNATDVEGIDPVGNEWTDRQHPRPVLVAEDGFENGTSTVTTSTAAAAVTQATTVVAKEEEEEASEEEEDASSKEEEEDEEETEETEQTKETEENEDASSHPTVTAIKPGAINTTEADWFLMPNPFVSKFNTTEWSDFLKEQWEERVETSIFINEDFGTYCPKEPAVPMCPPLTEEGTAEPKWIRKWPKGELVECTQTGGGEERCGIGSPWLNKTLWPLVRGPLCAKHDAQRRSKFPLPDELAPYMELGYDRSNTTNSADAAPFDGGPASSDGETSSAPLPFDPDTATDHFLRFEAMLEHYYEGLARPLLERQLAPAPDDPLYGPMLTAHADQIARALLRAAKSEGDGRMVIGVLGDSVTAGTDNCYYDAWPEVLRMQLAPLYAAVGIELEVRNAAKNGGWNLASQMMCAHDMLGASDRPDDLGLDFLIQCNPFVKSENIDAEHLVRRALLGNSHTVVSITPQKDTSVELMLEKYAAAGLTFGTPFQDAVPELGIPEKGYKYWFPNQSRAFWGMQGDGFCHLTTRAGSSAVVNRNWHWGPKMHQTYADAYALLFSRATRQAIDDLSAGRMPSEPPAPRDYAEPVLSVKEEGDAVPPTWQKLLLQDMASDEVVGGGIGGVRCAVGSANQPGSTLLPDWLRPAESSPFEEKMKSRGGKSFVPLDEEKIGLGLGGLDFYSTKSPISTPNGAVPVGDWVENPEGFGAEAPRTIEQCQHVDGSTLVNFGKHHPEGVSWLVWEVPMGAVSIGRAMLCHPRGSHLVLVEGAFDKGFIRAHYAVPDGNGEWRVVEDAHAMTEPPMNFMGQECSPVIGGMNDVADVKAAKEGGMWVAVEWREEAIVDSAPLNFDYLVAM